MSKTRILLNEEVIDSKRGCMSPSSRYMSSSTQMKDTIQTSGAVGILPPCRPWIVKTTVNDHEVQHVTWRNESAKTKISLNFSIFVLPYTKPQDGTATPTLHHGQYSSSGRSTPHCPRGGLVSK